MAVQAFFFIITVMKKERIGKADSKYKPDYRRNVLPT